MPPELEKYRRFVDHFDLSDGEKSELIHMVYDIMQSFVDRAFGDDPVQAVLFERQAKDAFDSACMVGSKPVSNTFIQPDLPGERIG